MPEAYVGITGFKHAGQVEAVLPAITGPRKLMVGVLASQKTIAKGHYEENSRSPKRGDIGYIFPAGDETLNLIHYFTKDQTDLEGQLTAAYYFGGPHCHGLQLNIAWPDPEVLRRFSYFSGHNRKIVLQVGGRRDKQLYDYEPRELALKILGEYDGAIDYVLLDTSGGLGGEPGRELDVDKIRPYVENLDALFSVSRRSIGIGIAGGLSADTIEKIRPLCEDIPNLSFDAEGRLHNAPGQLDLDHCRRYAVAAGTIPV